MRPVFIYVLLDIYGRRRYVGKSVDPKRRLKDHQRSRFQWAVSVEILEACDKARWPERERFWIAHGRSNGWPLENIADGGNAVPDWYQHSEATRTKIAEASRGNTNALGKTFSLETRARMSEAARNRTPEHRAKLAESISRNKSLPEARAKLAEANRKRVWTPEMRAKLATANRGKTLSPEHRAKISDAGYRRLPASYTKAAEANRGQKRSIETRAKMSASQLGRKHSVETRAKMSVSAKRRWQRDDSSTDARVA